MRGAAGGGGTLLLGRGVATTGALGVSTFGAGGATRGTDRAMEGLGLGGAATRAAGGFTTAFTVGLTTGATGFLMLGVGGSTVFRGLGIAATAGGGFSAAARLDTNGLFSCRAGAFDLEDKPCGNESCERGGLAGGGSKLPG